MPQTFSSRHLCLKIKNLNPVLAVEPTIVASDLSQLPVVNLRTTGDPSGYLDLLPADPGQEEALEQESAEALAPAADLVSGRGRRRYRRRSLPSGRRRQCPGCDISG